MAPRPDTCGHGEDRASCPAPCLCGALCHAHAAWPDARTCASSDCTDYQPQDASQYAGHRPLQLHAHPIRLAIACGWCGAVEDGPRFPPRPLGADPAAWALLHREEAAQATAAWVVDVRQLHRDCTPRPLPVARLELRDAAVDVCASLPDGTQRVLAAQQHTLVVVLGDEAADPGAQLRQQAVQCMARAWRQAAAAGATLDRPQALFTAAYHAARQLLQGEGYEVEPAAWLV